MADCRPHPRADPRRHPERSEGVSGGAARLRCAQNDETGACMTPTTANAFVRPARFSAAEWEARVQLAAAYRIFDLLGWTELIYNHISLRVPDDPACYLINPFGLHYSEVCASNLVKVDREGKVVGHSDWPINPAGITFHGA